MLLRPVVRAVAVRMLALPAGADRVAVPPGTGLARSPSAVRGGGPCARGPDLWRPRLPAPRLARPGRRVRLLRR
ncbi:hypothetical protein, partial [Kitasatospora aureofaciens]|uniref:hypothetical protein n=1 Tax=Kitasatospora aureofaciens TaxID=1894 RepID=UPI001B7FF84B